MPRVVDDPFRHVLEKHMRCVGKDLPVLDGLTFDAVWGAVVGVLYRNPDGACAEWISEKTDHSVDEVNAVLLGCDGSFFIYYEKVGPVGRARWRLTADAWTEEAARRAEAQPRGD